MNWAALATRPWVQYAQFAWLGEGGAKALIGRDGWYFYRPGVNYLLTRPEHVPTNAPGSDPLPAILDFQGQLAARGIHLLLMPVPNKESVYPDRLTSRPVSTNGVMAPRTRDLLDRLRAANVEVVNLFEAFGRARASASQSQVPLLPCPGYPLVAGRSEDRGGGGGPPFAGTGMDSPWAGRTTRRRP